MYGSLSIHSGATKSSVISNSKGGRSTLAANGQKLLDSYRVIVLRRRGTEVLVVPDGMQYRFPWVEVDRNHRLAEAVGTHVRNLWGEEIICISSENDSNRYQIAEHRRNVSQPHRPTLWTSLTALSRESFDDDLDYEQLQRAIQKIQGPPDDTCFEPFARLGWFDVLCAWAEAAARPFGIRLNGNFRQFNASNSFSLIRFEGDDSAVWFKAVGKPNQREFPITLTLAELAPAYLPPILAVHNEWNGLLMQECEGDSLDDARDSETWCTVVRALALLQITSMPQASRVRAAGAHDFADSRLSEFVPDFIETMALLMDRQTTISPAVLSRKELGLLQTSIQEALLLIQNVDLPDALGHLDLNPQNIIVGVKGCRFLDWAEAYVGNPFLSFQYLLEHYRRSPWATTDGEWVLRNEYYRPWKRVIASDVISEVLPFLPLLAVFGYAAGDEQWADPLRLQEPGYAAYLRSLTRRMFREANALRQGRSLCLA